MKSKIEIYYLCYENTPSSFVIKQYIKVNVSNDEFKKYYIKVFENECDDNLKENKIIFKHLESLFSLFNFEKNPLINDDSQKFIINNKLHTSMSIGDIIKINEQYYCCAAMGFEKFNLN